MKCYFMAQIEIHNEVEYGQYLEGADTVFSKFKGRYLAVDNNPEVLEGEWEFSRAVLIEFPDEAELHRWYNSVEYKKLLKYRLNAARCNTIVIKGLE